jgi:hypothetical protein
VKNFFWICDSFKHIPIVLEKNGAGDGDPARIGQSNCVAACLKNRIKITRTNVFL